MVNAEALGRLPHSGLTGLRSPMRDRPGGAYITGAATNATVIKLEVKIRK